MTHAIDLKFRPQSYFWAKDHGIALLSDIKGANRREIYSQALANDAADTLSPAFAQHALHEEDRRLMGRIHPSFMGGEYLPNTGRQEVEIARITIASTTRDVTCVYARPLGRRIAHRIVDEYNGDTVTGTAERTSLAPLSLGALVKFFIHGWDLLGCLDYNFGEDGYPREEVHAFIVDASSSFYSEFGQAITEEVDRWLDKKHSNNPPQREDEEAGDDETAGEGQPLDLMNLPFDPAQAAMRSCEKKQTGK
jgi:hypothetical protein